MIQESLRAVQKSQTEKVKIEEAGNRNNEELSQTEARPPGGHPFRFKIRVLFKPAPVIFDRSDGVMKKNSVQVSDRPVNYQCFMDGPLKFSRPPAEQPQDMLASLPSVTELLAENKIGAGNVKPVP